MNDKKRKHLLRSHVLLAIVVLFLLNSCVSEEKSKQEAESEVKQPNIVFIMSVLYESNPNSPIFFQAAGCQAARRKTISLQKDIFVL